MHYTPFAIECLKQDLEKKYNRTCKSPADFKLMALMISSEEIPVDKDGSRISESTLRRIWGYSKSQSTTRLSTLTALVRCLGYRDWDEYHTHLLQEKRVESDFITTGSIEPADIRPGDCLRLTWNPEREVTLVYEGEEWFRVESQTNSKLRPGDLFRASIFRKGAPLMCLDVRRGDTSLGHYVAGEATGLTSITYLNGK